MNNNQWKIDKKEFRQMADRRIPAMNEQLKQRIMEAAAQPEKQEIADRPDRQELSELSPLPSSKQNKNIKILKRQKRQHSVSRKVLLVAIITIFALGTVFAMTVRSGLWSFYSQEDYHVIEPDITNVFAEDRVGEVSLVLEELFNTDGGYAIAFSFKNYSEVLWPEGVYLDEVKVTVEPEWEDQDYTGFIRFGAGEMSPDRNVITYVKEEENNRQLSGRTLVLRAERLTREVREQRDTLFKVEDFLPDLQVLNELDDEILADGDYFYAAAQPIYNSLAARGSVMREPVILCDEFPEIQVVAAALIGPGILDEGREKGLCLFIKEQSGREAETSAPFIDFVHYMFINRETGQMADYTSPWFTTEDGELIRALLFFDIDSQEEAARYDLQSIDVTIHETVAEGPWEIRYEVDVEDLGWRESLMTELTPVEGVSIPCDLSVAVTPFGVTVSGYAYGTEDDLRHLQDWNPELTVKTEAGEVLPMRKSKGSFRENGGIGSVLYGFQFYDEAADLDKMLDIRSVASVQVEDVLIEPVWD